MTGTEKNCPDCRGFMVEGFIIDMSGQGGGFGGRVVPRWLKGRPEKSFWAGVKVSGKDCYTVETYRCEQCGLLRSYATEEAEPPDMWGK